MIVVKSSLGSGVGAGKPLLEAVVLETSLLKLDTKRDMQHPSQVTSSLLLTFRLETSEKRRVVAVQKVGQGLARVGR